MRRTTPAINSQLGTMCKVGPSSPRNLSSRIPHNKGLKPLIISSLTVSRPAIHSRPATPNSPATHRVMCSPATTHHLRHPLPPACNR